MPGSNDMPTTLDRDHLRSNLLPYTREAFGLLPKLKKPRILDIGCGSGASTLELARISDGDIVAVDIDQEALDNLVSRAAEESLSDRITVIHTSMMKMDFPPNSFDVIWTEGAISFIGFERGLREWRGFLVDDGYLVVHDAMSGLQRKARLAHTCGYTILGQFELPPDIWWNEYYAPLKDQVETLKSAGPPSKAIRDEIKKAEREIAGFDPKNDRFGSVFFVLRKT